MNKLTKSFTLNNRVKKLEKNGGGGGEITPEKLKQVLQGSKYISVDDAESGNKLEVSFDFTDKDEFVSELNVTKLYKHNVQFTAGDRIFNFYFLSNSYEEFTDIEDIENDYELIGLYATRHPVGETNIQFLGKSVMIWAHRGYALSTAGFNEIFNYDEGTGATLDSDTVTEY